MLFSSMEKNLGFIFLYLNKMLDEKSINIK